ncbi:MAG: small multi-drug export protein [Anaerolineae bacterium]|nr:small multi-drug export protein [Anaerolineae bacterium]
MFLSKVASIFAWAFLSFWTAIPGGIALGLTPLVVGVTAWFSYSVGVVVVVLLGEPIRAWVMRRFGNSLMGNPNSPIQRAWDRFGLLGLSILAPLTTGAQIGAAVGLTLGVPRHRLLIGMILGAAVWAALITAAVALGLMGAQAIR